MSKEEILRYIFSCVSYKHMFDLSPRITDSAQKKEGGNGTPKFEKESYDNSEPENQMPPSDEFIEDFPF